MRRRPAWGALVVLAALVATIVPRPAGADDLDDRLDDVVDRIRALSAQIDDVTAERSGLAARIRSAGGSLDLLVGDIAANEAEIDSLEARIAGGEATLHDMRRILDGWYEQLSVTRTQIAAQRSEALEAARASYVRGRRDVAALAFAAEELTDISVGLVYLERVARHNDGVLTGLLVLEEAAAGQEAEIDSRRADLEVELARSVALHGELEETRGKLEADRLALESSMADLEALLAELDASLIEFESELEALDAEQHSISAAIAAEQAARRRREQEEARLRAERERQQQQDHQESGGQDGGRPATTTPPSTTNAPEPDSAGFVRPVPGPITSGFGPRLHPILGYTRIHTGVDFRAPNGQRIKAAASGTVILARTWGGYGRTVVIDHGDGLSTLYAHMSSISVSKGDRVQAGETIGRVGSSGLATGAHLHFETRIDGEPVDPMPYLQG